MRTMRQLDDIVAFLNFPSTAPLGAVREFLLSRGVCSHVFMTGASSARWYSLYTWRAVIGVSLSGEALPPHLVAAAGEAAKRYAAETGNTYEHAGAAAASARAALHSGGDMTPHSVLRVTVGAEGEEPERRDDAPGTPGAPGEAGELAGAAESPAMEVVFPPVKALQDPEADPVRRAFHAVREWFAGFMEGCALGHVDARQLNRFASRDGFFLSFRPDRSGMNPGISIRPAVPRPEADYLERRVLETFIYPVLLAFRGNELARVRRCRQCGAYFHASRVSTVFCGARCRASYSYMERLVEKRLAGRGAA